MSTSLTTVGHVASIIDTAIAPVFMLAGIGAFLNVCANRLSRIVDRARDIEPRLLASRGEEHARWLSELRVLDRRFDIVNWAIFFTVLSAVLICSVVVLMFSDPFTTTPLGVPIALLFMGSMAAIGIAFFIFLVETRVASRFARIRVDLLTHQPDPDED